MSDPFSFCPVEPRFFENVPGLIATALLFPYVDEVHAVQHNASLLAPWPDEFFSAIARLLRQAEACALATDGFRLMLAQGFVTGFRRGPGVYLVLITQKHELSPTLCQQLAHPPQAGGWPEALQGSDLFSVSSAQIEPEDPCLEG